MEAIAMRMTQEEFDSIKILLKLRIYKIGFFYQTPYLVNNFGGEIGVISNVYAEDKNKNNRKVYEFFDKDIFLKACDIEVEKVLKPMNIKYFNGNKFIQLEAYEVKPQPDYSKEIESLQEKAELNGMKAIITFDKI